MQTETPWRIGDAGFTVFGPPTGEPAPKIVAQLKNREDGPLIASAPELLAALKGILEEYRADCEAQGGSDEDCDSDAYKIAFEVIAKAEGRA